MILIDAILGLPLTTYISAFWDYALKYIIAAAFTVAVSGEKVSIRKKIICGALSGIMLTAVLFIAEHNRFIYINPYVLSVILACLLVLISLISGERKIMNSVMYSLVAVNVLKAVSVAIGEGIGVFVDRGSFDSGLDYSIAASNIGHSTFNRIMAVAVVFMILFFIAFFLKKNRVVLGKSETVITLAILIIITVMTALIGDILTYTRQYTLFRVIRVDLSELTVLLSTICLFLLLAVIAAVYYLIVRIMKKQKEKMNYEMIIERNRNQEAIIDEVKRQYETISKIRHDYLNTFGVLDFLIASGRSEEAREYIKKNTGIISSGTRIVDTNNEYLNSIIAYKTTQAKEKGVDISVYSDTNIDFPDNTDLCSLIGNMLDNGITAAQKCDDRKEIRLDIRNEGDSYQISVINTVISPVLKGNPNLETTNANKIAHGYGVKIIREIVKKYYGTFDYYDTDDLKFCCVVVLYTKKPF